MASSRLSELQPQAGNVSIPVSSSKSQIDTRYQVEVKKLLNQIRTNITEVGKLKLKINTETDPYEKALPQLEKLATSVKGLTAQVRQILTDRREQNNREAQDCAHGGELSIHIVLVKKLGNEFTTVMGEWEDANNDVQTALKAKVKRQATIFKPDITDQEVETMVQDPKKFLQQTMEMSEGFVKYVGELETRRDKILQIERDMVEISKIVREFAFMIEEQQVILDNTEQEVSDAKNLVDEATIQLVKAKEHQDKARKCTCNAMVILVVVLILFLLVGGTIIAVVA